MTSRKRSCYPYHNNVKRSLSKSLNQAYNILKNEACLTFNFLSIVYLITSRLSMSICLQQLSRIVITL